MQKAAEGKPAVLMFVDDSKADIELVENAFIAEKIHYISEVYEDGASALQRLEDNSRPLPDMVFIDRHLDGSAMTGDELIEKICTNRARYSVCHVVCISEIDPPPQIKDKFTKMGLETFFPKPLMMDNIKTLIRMTSDYYYQIMRELHQAVAA